MWKLSGGDVAGGGQIYGGVVGRLERGVNGNGEGAGWGGLSGGGKGNC